MKPVLSTCSFTFITQSKDPTKINLSSNFAELIIKVFISNTFCFDLIRLIKYKLVVWNQNFLSAAPDYKLSVLDFVFSLGKYLFIGKR